MLTRRQKKVIKLEGAKLLSKTNKFLDKNVLTLFKEQQKRKTTDKSLEQNINTKLVNIEKNLPSNSNIKAMYVNVSGKTHKKSYINAENVKIDTHYGVIEGGDVEVMHLNGGEIVANMVKIGTTSGGKITSNYITIDNLGSNTTLIATDTIKINKISGKDNKIIMNVAVNYEYMKPLLQISERFKIFNKEHDFLKPLIEYKCAKIEKKQEKLNKLYKEESLETDNFKNKNPSVNYLVDKRELDILEREQIKLENAFSNLKIKIDKDTSSFYLSQDKVLFPEIINNSSWGKDTKIKFNIAELGKEVNFNTEDEDSFKKITLEFEISGEFKIVKSENI